MREADTTGLRRGKQRVSDERLASIILDYLVQRFESRQSGCTAYDIARNAPKLPTTQRQQRIQEVTRLLEQQGLVRGDHFEHATYFSVTEKGLRWYKTVAKSFYEVLGPLYPRGGA